MTSLKVGVYGIGLDTYWDQFEGLYERLCDLQKTICCKLEKMNATIFNAGLVDTVQKANTVADYLKANDVDILFLFVSTYALSSTVLPVARRLKIPVIILNLQPVKAIDYDSFNKLGDRGKMTGEWLYHCQACSVPEVCNVFNKAGIKYEIVSGYMNDAEAWREIEEWVEAANVLKIMNNNTIGILGNYYSGMLDVYADLTRYSAVLGTHIEILEMCELKRNRDAVTAEQVKLKIKEFHEKFEVSPECLASELDRAARTSVALDRLVTDHQLTSMAFYYEGQDGNEYENIVTSVIAGNTLLTGRNVPVAGEYEIKNAHAMKIMDSFGSGGAFSEFYAMDFTDDIVLLGHDGPAHFMIAEGRVQLIPLPVYHGKPGKGLSIQMTVKHGPVTLLSVLEKNEGISFLVAEAESVDGPVLKIVNTNSRYRFPVTAKEFVNNWSKQGPSHHCAIGVGHIASKIQKLGILCDVPVTKIC